MHNFCCVFYGSCLWDLSHPSIDDLSTAWRKGLRRLWGLLYRTDINFTLAPLYDMLPLEYELMCHHCANFMNTCLVSCYELVNFAARNSIFFQRMVSPMGRNAQWCCDTVGLSLYSTHDINKDLVFHRVCSSSPGWFVTPIIIVHELLQVHCNRMCLQLLSELNFIVDVACTGLVKQLLFLFFILYFMCTFNLCTILILIIK